MSFTPASKALARFKVLDLTRVRAGPTAARQFADWGADVIKIELPRGLDESDMGGPRHGPDFQNLHRNKRSLTLNLKEADGIAIFQRMVKTADVVIENYRPDVKFRLGIDYESVRSINKRIVYGSISGFGEDGPYRERPGFDQIAQGMGGLMSITGLPGQGPVRVGIPVADLGAGIFCAMGILVALLEREVSGEGQWVQSSLLGAQISLLDFQAARWLIAKDVPGQAGNDHPTSIPTGVFPTRDGYINIAASGKHIFKRFCQTLDLAHLLQNPLFADDACRDQAAYFASLALIPELSARALRPAACRRRTGARAPRASSSSRKDCREMAGCRAASASPAARIGQRLAERRVQRAYGLLGVPFAT
jgi:crotonobetainyl-CoA:carnitine CoA-transferase CaiB-like acyl-CoA transferase